MRGRGAGDFEEKFDGKLRRERVKIAAAVAAALFETLLRVDEIGDATPSTAAISDEIGGSQTFEFSFREFIEAAAIEAAEPATEV